MTRLRTQTLSHRPLADLEIKESLDFPMDLDEAHRAFGPSENLQNRTSHRPELQLPVTRPVTTFALHMGHLSPLPFRETLEENLRLKV